MSAFFYFGIILVSPHAKALQQRCDCSGHPRAAQHGCYQPRRGGGNAAHVSPIPKKPKPLLFSSPVSPHLGPGQTTPWGAARQRAGTGRHRRVRWGWRVAGDTLCRGLSPQVRPNCPRRAARCGPEEQHRLNEVNKYTEHVEIKATSFPFLPARSLPFHMGVFLVIFFNF